ncbi:acyl-CoA synthetase [Mycolicibacter algericus]|uniref:Long-chain-fatty-acid--CoA ligase FadD13 n=2 Tax=Mycolicibacter algericus TaxID=1288388 RepID=A0A7I9YAF5_MYCAL|nr:long-chain fatty acid--CoA ligase [Mycolicibacter algericus]OQZ94050.1 p-hydroxycinnamoyl-CoA synthetase [Mycolicibacter algericus DSM 45454]GFG85584.1 acyl-CoA synthetase [Mycolicibacter algericus]
MLNQGVGSWPFRRARQTPDATAIVFGEHRYTYRELAERATRLAHGLRALGVGQGDRVALLCTNHPAYLEGLFAAGLLGAVLVPLNIRLASAEVAYALRDSGARVLIHAGALTDVALPAAQAAQVPTRVVLDDEPGPGAVGYEEIIAASGAEAIDITVERDDPCFIMYTSGTTGYPKGVVLSHDTVLFAVLNPIIDLDLCSDEVSLVAAPMFHTGALNFVALPTVLKGGTVVIEESFDAGRALSVIERERVTYSFSVPTMLDAMSEHPHWGDTNLGSIRRWIVAAAPVPLRTLRTYATRGVALCQAYGLTETGPGALVLRPAEAGRKLGSAGVPHFFTDVRVVTADDTEAAPGERGEIQISGPNVMRRYWNRPEATESAFGADGWFRSGDVGVRDDEGYITVVDRIKDMIISGGENIYPAEVENAILEMPGVRHCAVFGVPDDKWGEVGCAAVVLADGCAVGKPELDAFLGDRLARYKLPASLMVLDELPVNGTGKILKGELRARFAG